MYNKGAQAYLQTQVQSRTPVELVVMLYDGAITFLGQARDAMTAGDLMAKRHALSRGLERRVTILDETAVRLRATGDRAARLQRRLERVFAIYDSTKRR